MRVDIALYVLSRHCPGIAKKGGGRQIHHCAKMGVRVRGGGVKSILEILKFESAWSLELITFEILAAERLRLVGFDNRLIIDCFANVVYLDGNFLQMIDSEVRNMKPLHYIQNHFQK